MTQNRCARFLRKVMSQTAWHNMTAYSIGVDIGGTNLRIAAYARGASGFLDSIALPTRLGDGRDAVVLDLRNAVRQLMDRYSPRLTLSGIGVGSPGPLELPAGRLRNPPNLPGWDGFELRAAIERALGMPVFLENDANAAALAECTLGRGKQLGIDSLCMLTLGTGVGGGIILDGKIYDGMTGMAGELGHINIWPDGVTCGCGGQGCLEPYASATGARRIAEDMIATGRAPGLASLRKRSADFSAREISELAQTGDRSAKLVFGTVGSAIGIGLATLINTLNLPLYVIGGGLAASWALFSPALFRELNARSYVYRLVNAEEPDKQGRRIGKTLIEPAELGPDSGLLGACLLPFAPSSPDSGNVRLHGTRTNKDKQDIQRLNRGMHET